MGFSTNQCLQGKIAHEALLSRQEAELRVLDGMKRCINLRVKCDKEYASALSVVAIQGLKIVDRGDDLTGSLVSLAWKNIMEELENTSKLIKQNADNVETKIIDVFSALIVEKRKVKKTYQEEHSRISQQFTHLSDEVTRKKQEYQKYLELYKLMRCKFEEIYIKGGRCGGRKLDEVRDKYQKACRKLHLTHNEYVLLLCEASEFEKDFRSVLLPGLLEHQQSLQESFVFNWKQILHDITTTLNLTSEKFSEIHQRIETNLDSIRQPYEEYKEFIDKYKSSAPNEPSKFIFDECLVEDSSSAPAKLLPNQLTVDNLTVEWLRNKLSDLENSIKEFQEEKQRNSINGSGDDGNSQLANGKNTTTNDNNINSSNRLSLDSVSSLRKKETNELRCHERNTLKQIELIKGALNELGCEEVPSGCDDISIENQSSPTAAAATVTSTIPSIIPSALSTGVSDSYREEKQDEISSSSGGGGGGGVIDNDDDLEANKLLNQSTNNNNLTTFHYSERFVKMFLPNILSKKPFRWKNRISSISSTASTACSSPVAPPRRGGGKGSRSSRESSMAPRSEGSDDGGGGDVNGGGSGNNAASTNKSIVDEEWFHGVLPREEVVRLLTVDGDFLVRETTRNDECQTVLSVCWGGHKHFIVQTTAEGHYRFEGPAFPTIRDLILYQFSSGLPVTQRSGAILHKPIPRERWELNNDDVILLDKIGRGNFGDVYRAQLKNAKDIVAVKTCRVTLPEEHKKKFLQEGRILKQYDHPNIVKLIGICVQKQPIMIVMELVPAGSLLTFLRKKAASLTENQQLMKMCLDAAAGMKYLESKNCIHRDLAARNCLVGYNNIVKISDFGMSREEEEYIVSDGMKQIPIKWTAPEALNFGKYTSACDVWSYGILCWEIFSKGDTPYNGMNNTKAREKIDNGYRMPAPENTPAEMYRLMLSCWEYKPENRPNFERIYSIVETLYNAYRF